MALPAKKPTPTPAVVKPVNNMISEISEADLIDFLNVSGFSNINNNTKTTFLKLAQAHGLNPFKKEIYITGYKSRSGQEVYSVVTGYQTFIKLANKTGLLNGWKADEVRDNGQLVGAKVTIYRKDWDFPFEWTVSLSEFDKGQSVWNQMKGFMIRKVCIGQAFRLCFEGVEGIDMNGLYEEAELVGIEDENYVKQNKADKPANPAKLMLDFLTENGLTKQEAGRFVKEELELKSSDTEALQNWLDDEKALLDRIRMFTGDAAIDEEPDIFDADVEESTDTQRDIDRLF
jgi:uncharacterized short protein YbdD (DUF466 family)